MIGVFSHLTGTALAALALAALAACSTAVHNGEVSSIPGTPTVPQRMLEAVNQRIYGGAHETYVQELLTHASVQGALQECMRKQGFRYQPPPFASLITKERAVAVATSYTAFSSLGEPHVQTPSDEVMASLRMNELAASAGDGTETLSSTQLRSYNAAMEACNTNTTSIAAGVQDVGGATGERLRALLDQLESEISADPAVVEAEKQYGECMNQAGIAVASAQDLWRYLSDAAQVSSEPLSEKDPRWRDVVRKEREVLEIDRRCRLPVREAGLAVMGPQLQKFVETHSLELLEMDAAWKKLRDREAQALKELRALNRAAKQATPSPS